MLTGFFKVKKM